MGNADALIGVLDSDYQISRDLGQVLDREGYSVKLYDGPQQMMASIKRMEPSLLLLDDRPEASPEDAGSAWARRVRSFSKTPIIILGHDDQSAVVRGLDAGADDFVAKPLVTETLLARIRSNLRRAAYTNGAARSEPKNRFVNVDGVQIDMNAPALVGPTRQRISLTDCEFGILKVLLDCPNEVASRERMFADVFGTQWDPRDRRVDLHVSHLRRKFQLCGADPVPVMTVRGRGYRLEGSVRSHFSEAA